MISGKHPWSEIEASLENLLQIIGNTTKGPKYPEEISLNLKSFLDECFIIDKNERPDAGKLLEHSFLCQINKEQSSQIMLQMSLAITNLNTIAQGNQINEDNLSSNQQNKKMPKSTTTALDQFKRDHI